MTRPFFSRALRLKRATKSRAFFFYHDGVYNASRLATPPQDDRNVGARWSKLAADHGVDLVVCVAAAQRRGITDGVLGDNFRISGLGQLVEMGIQYDRLVTFGD